MKTSNKISINRKAMKTSISYILVLISIIFISPLSAQQMGVNTETPDPQAILDITSSNKGLLIPRMTNSSRPAGVNGLMIYNTTTNAYNFFENGNWRTPAYPWSYTTNGNPYVEDNNVGIGESNPQYKLDIKSSSSSLLRLHRNSSGVSTIAFSNSNNGMTLGMASNGDFIVGKTTSIDQNLLKIEDTGDAGELLVKSQLGGIVPSGGIIMWSGSTIPEGWVLCNGSNGTPNLQNRFIQGGSIGQIGGTGGSASNSHTHSVNPPNTTSTTSGAHDHTVNPGSFDAVFYTGPGSTTKAGNISFNLPGSFTHASVNVPTTTSSEHTGHTHDVNIGSFTSGGASTNENRPPYYVLAFIMKK